MLANAAGQTQGRLKGWLKEVLGVERRGDLILEAGTNEEDKKKRRG